MSALVKPGRQKKPGLIGRLSRSLRNKAPAWIYELFSLGYNLVGYLDLRKKIKSQKFDMIYERYSLNTFCGVWASRRFGIPIILEVNAPLYYEQLNLGRLAFRRLAWFSERWICSNSTWTIAVTTVLKQMLQDEGIKPGKVVVMHNGIDPLLFNTEISGRHVRERYHVEGKLVIGFVGWFRPWHGLDMFLEAVHEINPLTHKLHVLLVGDGPSYQQLHRYCEATGMLESVTFSGPVAREEIPAYIAAMDMVVQPSATEYACPMKIIEYMAMAKCILAPDQRNITELLEDGASAFLFNAGNSSSLRQKILQALDSSDRRVAVGQAAYRTLMEKQLLWRSNALRVLSLVDGCGSR